MFRGSREAAVELLLALVLMAFALWAWRWAAREGTYRLSVRHLGGLLVGMGAAALAVLFLFMLHDLAMRQNQWISGSLSFLAPVQQSSSALTVEVSNFRDEMTFWRAVGSAWPALLALVAFAWAILKARDTARSIMIALGWSLLAWAALRWPNGAPLFFILIILFLLVNVMLPALRVVLRVPRKTTGPAEGAGAPVTAALLLAGLLGLASFHAEAAQPLSRPLQKDPPIAESVTQQIRVEEKFAFATAKIRWHALKDQLLPVLF